ncbi:hypothetical protein RUM43_010169 [Polyplax serrata]|uniref:Uncharacterized protein n=1 Tax=Polyplax serrata TaxID=468196 RepID=A0AAN8S7X0_POLSC
MFAQAIDPSATFVRPRVDFLDFNLVITGEDDQISDFVYKHGMENMLPIAHGEMGKRAEIKRKGKEAPEEKRQTRKFLGNCLFPSKWLTTINSVKSKKDF